MLPNTAQITIPAAGPITRQLLTHVVTMIAAHEQAPINQVSDAFLSIAGAQVLSVEIGSTLIEWKPSDVNPSGDFVVTFHYAPKLESAFKPLYT